MKKAAGVLRSLMRTSIRTARRGMAVNRLMAAMLTPALPPQRKTRSKAGPAGKIKPGGKARPPQPPQGTDPVRGPSPPSQSVVPSPTVRGRSPASQAPSPPSQSLVPSPMVRGRSPASQAPSPPSQSVVPSPTVRGRSPASQPPSPASQAPSPASPAPNPRPEGKWLAYAIEGAHGRRLRYWLYLPHQPATAAEGLPLVVMLHGCHQSATEFAAGTRMNLWAERQGFAILYPQQSASSQAQRCWKWYDRATQDGGGDVPAIMAMLDVATAVAADHGRSIDRTRIYAAGMSAGAGMAHILALQHPHLFAAVGLHSGPVFGASHGAVGALGALGVMQRGGGARAELAVMRVMARQVRYPGMPAILIQGEEDRVVRPINQLELARQALAFNGLPADALAKTTYKAQGERSRHNAHRIDDFYAGKKLLLRVVCIAALEHAWSGGDATLKFNDGTGPDASKLMLEFFARHQR